MGEDPDLQWKFFPQPGGNQPHVCPKETWQFHLTSWECLRPSEIKLRDNTITASARVMAKRQMEGSAQGTRFSVLYYMVHFAIIMLPRIDELSNHVLMFFHYFIRVHRETRTGDDVSASLLWFPPLCRQRGCQMVPAPRLFYQLLHSLLIVQHDRLWSLLYQPIFHSSATHTLIIYRWMCFLHSSTEDVFDSPNLCPCRISLIN